MSSILVLPRVYLGFDSVWGSSDFRKDVSWPVGAGVTVAILSKSWQHALVFTPRYQYHRGNQSETLGGHELMFTLGYGNMLNFADSSRDD